MAEDDDPPTPEDGAEAVARLGIDVGKWAAEIRARVAAALSEPDRDERGTRDGESA